MFWDIVTAQWYLVDWSQVPVKMTVRQTFSINVAIARSGAGGKDNDLGASFAAPDILDGSPK